MDTTSSDSPLAISIVAIVISLTTVAVSLYIHFRQAKHEDYDYLANTWYRILQATEQFPDFFDASITTDYIERLPHDQLPQYDLYCYQAWGNVEDIVTKGLDTEPKYRAVIGWMVGYHLLWVQRNPTFFTNPRFWETVDEIADQPQLVIRYHPLPSTPNDDIDWNTVSGDYFRYFLSPFAPEMVASSSSSPMRNLLLAHLLSLPAAQLRQATLADFGSGPGNLIPHLRSRIDRIVCVDKSDVALEKARAVGLENDIVCETHRQNLEDLDIPNKFDLIVSSNSVLPRTRRDVVAILQSIRNSLSDDGVLLAILPAYDATVHLRNLWHSFYETSFGAEQAQRIVDALIANKKADDITLSYADDGRKVQCYHDLYSIYDELPKAGLKICAPPEKIYYPWELARQFDYGYFPGEEQVWDWFVIAKREKGRATPPGIERMGEAG